jgi:hypothetical protein
MANATGAGDHHAADVVVPLWVRDPTRARAVRLSCGWVQKSRIGALIQPSRKKDLCVFSVVTQHLAISPPTIVVFFAVHS